MSTASPSRRPGVPAPPRPPLKIYPGAIFPESSVFMIGYHPLIVEPNAVVHPRVRFTTLHGPVRIAPGAIISERSMIGVQQVDGPGLGAAKGTIPAGTPTKGPTESSSGTASIPPNHSVTIERGVTVEPGAYVEATIVRTGSVIEVGARIGRGCDIGRFCKICPYITIPAGETLPDYTVVYGNGSGERRIDHAGATEAGLDNLKLRVNDVHAHLLKKLIVVPQKRAA